MNYFEWSQEYVNTVAQLDRVLTRLKKERATACESRKKELSDRITQYRCCRRECMEIADRLMKRDRGIA